MLIKLLEYSLLQILENAVMYSVISTLILFLFIDAVFLLLPLRSNGQAIMFDSCGFVFLLFFLAYSQR